MAKGQKAKSNVTEVIARAFGDDYVGEFDKKLYVWANDENGERIQVSLALTCPKVFRGVEATAPTALNFEDEEDKAEPAFKPAEITNEEKQTLADLMNKLGL